MRHRIEDREWKWIGGIALVILLICFYVADGVLGVARTPYSVTIAERLVTEEELPGLVTGAGTAQIEWSVPLEQGDHLLLHLTLEVSEEDTVSENEASESRPMIMAELWSDGILCDGGKETSFSAGETQLDIPLDHYRVRHGESGQLRVLFGNFSELRLRAAAVDACVYRTGFSAGLVLILVAVILLALLSIGIALIALLHCVGMVRARGVSDLLSTVRERCLESLFLCLLILLGLLALYHGIDLRIPIDFSRIPGDEKEYLFNSYMILRGEPSFTDFHTAGISMAESFDFPMTEKLQIFLTACLGWITQDVYLTANLFYLACYFLNGLSALYVCRQLGLSRPARLTVSVLYSFSVFISLRYFHLWLCAYFMLPIACLLAFRIMDGTYERGTGGQRSRPLSEAVFWSILCALTGLYYAYFSCALLAIALVCRLLQTRGGMRGKGLGLGMLLATIATTLLCLLPSGTYLLRHGAANGELSRRYPAQAERYSLKLIQLVLPRLEHRIPLLRDWNEMYSSAYDHLAKYWSAFPSFWVNENMTSTLGIVALIGTVVAIAALLRGRQDRLGQHTVVLLLAVLLIATEGGVGTILAFCGLAMIRSYNRMSLILLFLGLLSAARVAERLLRGRSRVLQLGVWLTLLLCGFLDQTVKAEQPEAEYFTQLRAFAGELGESLPDGAMIFTLPIHEYPSEGSHGELIAAIEAERQIWSCGAIEARREAQWQEAIASQGTGGMIESLRSAGYDGIYLDLQSYYILRGAEETLQKAEEITEYLGQPPRLSENGQQCFWVIPSA